MRILTYIFMLSLGAMALKAQNKTEKNGLRN